MKKTLIISNGVALVATIVLNYLSNTGVFNGNTMKTISDKYFNYFTPAGYAFSIWGVIYLGLLCFVFYTGRSLFKKGDENSLYLKIGWWFVISCIANSTWVVVWLYDYPGLSALIMSIIFVSLAKILLQINAGRAKFSFKEYLFVSLPFTLYLGWISVAFVANMAAFLTKINWSGWGIAEITWTIVMIAIAGLINLFMIWKRNLPEFGLVGIWALMAISVANLNTGSSLSIVYTCYSVSALLLLAIIARVFKKQL